MSERRLESLQRIAHGRRTRQELRILTDVSSFVNAPADEILNDAPPDKAVQREMLSLTSGYLETTIHKLPDLFAKRTTVRYQESPMYLESDSIESYKPLHETDSWTTTIRYRNGHEVADTLRQGRTQRCDVGHLPGLAQLGHQEEQAIGQRDQRIQAMVGRQRIGRLAQLGVG